MKVIIMNNQKNYNRMRIFLCLLCLGIMLLGTYSCSESGSNQPSIEDLQNQIKELKSQLEKNSTIKNVIFEGDEMVLTFQDGSVFRTPTPSSVIPNIGENGNWWINGEDLGVKAVAQIPIVGKNGNWWIDGKDTGKTAQGNKGDTGATGTGIAKVQYDETTGVLKITLTDETYYEFTLAASGEGENLGGNKIEDLNGAYLLSQIKNGDFPFAEFTYSDNNYMTGVTYYQNLLNAPVKTVDLKREYNAAGKIIRQTITEYATQERIILQHDNRTQGGATLDVFKFVQMTATAIYDELFPQGINGSNQTKQDIIDKLVENSRSYFNSNFIYNLKKEGGIFFLKKRPLCKGYNDTQFSFALVKENDRYCLYAPRYYRDYGWSSAKNGELGYDLNDLSVEEYDNGGFHINYGRSAQCYYPEYISAFLAIKYTGAEDEKNENIIKDYETPPTEQIYNMTGETGKFKFLAAEYTHYKQGEAIRKITFNYMYNGNDYDVETEGENQFYVAMNGNKIDKIQVYENGVKKDLLKFNYNTDGNISTIDYPGEGATEVAKFTYDSRKNPIELSVNSYKLADKGYDNLFCGLGLAYRYQTYDENVGAIVEKVKYTNGYTPLLKISYNYGLKNFMNHTFTSMNPLLEGFSMKNAISEMAWAGHGSCFMAEYSDYNEGGYPTRLKGLLQLADGALEDFGIGNDPSIGTPPINGSIGTLYKFEYQKKK